MEEIPLPTGFLKRNLLPRRNFVKGKRGWQRLVVGMRAASTADSYVPGERRTQNNVNGCPVR